MSSNIQEELVTKLIFQKFGELSDWKKPEPLHAIGPHNLQTFDDFDTFRTMLLNETKETLKGLSQNELMALVNTRTKEDEALLQWWSSYISDEVGRLKRERSPAIAFGFGHPNFAPDYKYWSQMASLTLHEATLISVGCCPKKYSEDDLIKFAKKRERIWPALVFLLNRRELLKGYFANTGWVYRSMPTNYFWGLIQQIELEVPSTLSQLLDRRFPSKINVSDVPNETSVSWKREKDTLLKLVAAMSCEGYKFDPQRTKNSAVSDIESDLNTVGLSLDGKTIRKWLKESSELVHSDYWKK